MNHEKESVLAPVAICILVAVGLALPQENGRTLAIHEGGSNQVAKFIGWVVANVRVACEAIAIGRHTCDSRRDARACVCVCVCVRARVCVHVHAPWYAVIQHSLNILCRHATNMDDM